MNISREIFMLFIPKILRRYDLAEFPNVAEHVSPWCAIFSEENLKVMEFVDDLIFYQIGGYGHDINWKMTKPLVTELQKRFLEMRYTTNHTKLNHYAPCIVKYMVY